MIKYLITFLLLSSCATVHKGNWAKQVNSKKSSSKKKSIKVKFDPYAKGKKQRGIKSKTESGMIVSYQWNKNYSDKYFKYMELTFENSSPKWKKVEKIGIEFSDKSRKSKLYFLKGAPLAAFLKGKRLQLSVRSRNNAMIVGALAGFAAGAAATSSNNSYSNYQAGLVSVAVASSVANKSSQMSNVFPEEHLFGSKDKFLIPPGLAIEKYIVFNSENEENFKNMDKMYVTYILKSGEREKLELDISSY